MLQQTRDTECHCCFIVKYLRESHKQFIAPIPLVQYNWYCERGGDNDEALQWGRDLTNLFLAKDVYRRYLFFFISLRARSCELVDVFEKNEKKNKTTKERLFLYFSFSRARRCFLKERKEKWNNVCLQATLSNRLVTLTSPLTHVKDEAKVWWLWPSFWRLSKMKSNTNTTLLHFRIVSKLTANMQKMGAREARVTTVEE